MPVAVITGSAGLLGSEAAFVFAGQGFEVLGIDNDMRRSFFGSEASTRAQVGRLQECLGERYRHFDEDVRSADAIGALFGRYGASIELVIHAAAQPSHDWSASHPRTDFAINAVGTLNLLEATRQHAPRAVFIFASSNKVYGDTPNRLPLVEHERRWEIDPSHTYADGIREDMPIDQSLHSPFGVSKLAADALVQEYGRYFGLRTGCFRAGCLSGPHHAGTELHGFLAYLMRCTLRGTPYTVFGHKGKQVRDTLHSADLVRAFHEFYRHPRPAEVYNIGGGRRSHCSLLEAIELCERIAGRRLGWTYADQDRLGDHRWYVSDVSKFRNHYPTWNPRYDVPAILDEIVAAQASPA